MNAAEAEAIGRRWLAAGGDFPDGCRFRTGVVTRGLLGPLPVGTDFRLDGDKMDHKAEGRLELAWPDLRDAATRGACLDVVRERWGGALWAQGLVCYPPGDGPIPTRTGPVLRWVVGGLHRDAGRRLNGDGPDGFGTEAEAIVAALESSPKVGA